MDGNAKAPSPAIFSPSQRLVTEKNETAQNRELFDLNEIKSQPCRLKQIWAIGGGKGGVGKSLVASSLSIALARSGHQVIAADLDLGGANLHTTLGIDLPKTTLTDFVAGRTRSLTDCLVKTGLSRLDVLSGAQDAVTITNLGLNEKAQLLRSLKSLDADYLIIDLGAGTSFNTLDFFLFADIGFLTLLPEPTSIENGYRFIKSSYYRHLSLVPQLAPVRHLIETAMDPNNPDHIRSPADVFREVNQRHPDLGPILKREIERFKPKLILNQARTQTDIDIGSSVKTVCKKYFGIELDYLGFLDYDSAVWQSVRKKRPLLLEFPNSRIASNIEKMVQILLKPSLYRGETFY